MKGASKGRTYMIAVSGASCSGKTTLANCLQCALPNAYLVLQDDYYLPESELPIDPVTGYANWEVAAALKMDKLKEDLRSYKACRQAPSRSDDLVRNVHHGQTPQHLVKILADEWESYLRGQRSLLGVDQSGACTELGTPDRIVIVDGFLLFHDPKIVELFDLHIFLWVDKEALAARREARNVYATADNGFWHDPPGYFGDVVWPAFVTHHSRLLNSPPVLRWQKVEPSEHDSPVAAIFDESASTEYVLIQNDHQWDLEAVSHFVIPEIAQRMLKWSKSNKSDL